MVCGKIVAPPLSVCLPLCVAMIRLFGFTTFRRSGFFGDMGDGGGVLEGGSDFSGQKGKGEYIFS